MTYKMYRVTGYLLPKEEALSKASRSEHVERLRNVEEDFSRHKVYLDQLLTVITDQHPQLHAAAAYAGRSSKNEVRLTYYTSKLSYSFTPCIMIL